MVDLLSLLNVDAPDDDVEVDVGQVEGKWATYGRYQLVGHGEVTNQHCGRFISVKGCLRTDLHDLMTLNGQSFRGKVFVRKVHHWCCRPSCPTCYKSGWAVRQAGKIEARLAEASKRFGQVEHIVCSVPVSGYGLEYEVLRAKAVKVLKARGVIGGVLIFHGFRYNTVRRWYWSPHFHMLGVIQGGYGRCRDCVRKWNCLRGCGGFDDVNYRLFQRDGWIVKVLDERVTVFGTAWYQLNHASVKRGVTRFHVATWFGVCGYRKMKVETKARRHEDVCPICRYELVPLMYLGKRRFVLNRFSSAYRRDSFEDLVEDGRVVWVEGVGRSWHRGMVSGEPVSCGVMDVSSG